MHERLSNHVVKQKKKILVVTYVRYLHDMKKIKMHFYSLLTAPPHPPCQVGLITERNNVIKTFEKTWDKNCKIKNSIKN